MFKHFFFPIADHYQVDFKLCGDLASGLYPPLIASIATLALNKTLLPEGAVADARKTIEELWLEVYGRSA